jgi:hypothetical protein
MPSEQSRHGELPCPCRFSAFREDAPSGRETADAELQRQGRDRQLQVAFRTMPTDARFALQDCADGRR